MQHVRTLRRAALLGITLLSACAAGDPQARAGNAVDQPSGVYAAYLSGAHAVAMNDLPFAADRLLRAEAADPGNTDLRNRAFLASVVTGRPEAGRLARQLPTNPYAQLVLTNEDMQSGNWASAEKRLRMMSRQGPSEILQPLLLAWAQLGAGRPDDALATLRPQIQQGALRGSFALHAAMIADLAGRAPEAERLFTLAMQGEGAPSLRMAQLLASFEQRHGHAAEAERALRDRISLGEPLSMVLPALLKAAPTPVLRNARDGAAEVYLAMAEAQHQQQADDYAQLMLHMATELRSDLTPARLLLSDIQETAHQPELALTTLLPISAEDSLSGIVRLRRAALLAQADRAEDAKTDLRALAHDYPDRPEPLAELGAILRTQDRFAEAAEAYGAAIDRLRGPEAGAWRLFFARGAAYERAHDWQRAEPDLLRATEMAPNEPTVLNYLGYAWADQGRNLPAARRMLERAATLRPTDGAIIDSLGWAKLRQGNIEAAVIDLERATEMQPEDAVVNGHLGDAYWAVGRKLEAEYQWRRALNLHPEPEDLARIEGKLHQMGEDVVAPAEHAGATSSSLDRTRVQ